ncbi:hypothetical protein J2S14_002323 [Lederbergia wuyishanensis]|uniref:Uncharacterized protein n=1 Tax=Lederbergia wuyishanensis TaxID=1347903 RepID=A0ABU0D523_9BACI|nr:hypothetical protein [Lederbergia wuyishanensis]
MESKNRGFLQLQSVDKVIFDYVYALFVSSDYQPRKEIEWDDSRSGNSRKLVKFQ